MLSSHLNQIIPKKYRLDYDVDAPMLYAIWDTENDEIIGAGDTAQDAFRDARATVGSWLAHHHIDERVLCNANLQQPWNG